MAQSYCYECPKPPEFGAIGPSWDKIGWKVDVRFYSLENKIRPKDHIASLASLLPDKYSPLQKNGDGLQNVYLTEISYDLVMAFARLIGRQISDLMGKTLTLKTDEMAYQANPGYGLLEWEEHLRAQVEKDDSLSETERQSIVQARIGQGQFKAKVASLEKHCRLTKVDRMEHLRASHLRPWRDSTNEERLDGENGLLLTPTIDHLLDRGFISFEGDGELLVSPVAHLPSLQKMGVEVDKKINVGNFTDGQRGYLAYHRDNVFLQKR